MSNLAAWAAAKQLPCAEQVWNVNRYNGMVGVFNIQGSSWSRVRRQFVIHNATPPSLTTAVKPADVPLLAPSSSAPSQAAGHGSNGKQPHGLATENRKQAGGILDGVGPGQYVAYSNATQQLVKLGWQQGLDVSVAGMPHDV